MHSTFVRFFQFSSRSEIGPAVSGPGFSVDPQWRHAVLGEPWTNMVSVASPLPCPFYAEKEKILGLEPKHSNGER